MKVPSLNVRIKQHYFLTGKTNLRDLDSEREKVVYLTLILRDTVQKWSSLAYGTFLRMDHRRKQRLTLRPLYGLIRNLPEIRKKGRDMRCTSPNPTTPIQSFPGYTHSPVRNGDFFYSSYTTGVPSSVSWRRFPSRPSFTGSV